jgi:flagellar export protein FliJ
MNLSRLLAYRSQIEDALRIELGTAARVLQEAAEHTAFCEAKAKDKQRGYAEAAQRGLTVEEARRWYDDIEQASAMAVRSADTHAALHREWMHKQSAVVEAMQERKKLDILVSRREEARRQEQRHVDQRLMDEQAARRRGAESARVVARRNSDE